jgi:hypothetical protein
MRGQRVTAALYGRMVLILLLPWATTSFVSKHGRRGLPPRGPPRQALRISQGSPDLPSSVPLLALAYDRVNVTTLEETDEAAVMAVRGGSSTSSTRRRQQQQQAATGDVVKGTQATLSATANFWSSKVGQTLAGVQQRIQNLGKRLGQPFQSKEKRQKEALLEQLQTMPVQRVVVKDSAVLPPEVVQIATRRSGLLGQPLQTDRVQTLAASLKQWYDRQGYVLHSVTGATLETKTATAEIQVQEPILASPPVDIVFCKEMVVDNESGDLMTIRQYKDRMAVKKSFGGRRSHQQLDRASLNTTMLETGGRTKASRIAKAMGLRSGRPFQWKPQRWQHIVQSGIFARIVRATPQPLPDGTVQLQIVAQEAPTRHLEYGLGKSLYTGLWEGELDFEHANLLGGGEAVALSVRRGTKDAEPSVLLRFTDDRFGLEGGYDVEAFSDFIGDSPAPGEDEQPGEVTVQLVDTTGEEATAPFRAAAATSPNYDSDALMSRRGATFRLRNPFNPHIITHSMVSASMERTSTKTGLHENIGSATLKLGPFRRTLTADARSSIDTSITTGTRVLDTIPQNENESSHEFRPYVAVTASTMQVIPVLETRTMGNRPLILALRHSATFSSAHLPRHEAKAQGVANNIRGASANGRVASAIRGTTEVRIPVDLPRIRQQDASIVLFGDWLLATKDASFHFCRKSSVGIGIRKNLQGLPLHCNFCYAGDGKIKTLFGLGRDFDA